MDPAPQGNLSIDHLVSGNPRLRELTERNLLRTAQGGVVRVVPVPAAELVRLLAHTGIALPPPRLGLAVVHPVLDGPGHGDLADRGFAASLAPQGAREDGVIETPLRIIGNRIAESGSEKAGTAGRAAPDHA